MTTRTYTAEQAGIPLLVDLRLTAGTIRVYAEDRDRAQVTVCTNRASGAAADAVRAAAFSERRGALLVRLPDPPGGRATVIGNGGAFVSSGTTVVIGSFTGNTVINGMVFGGAAPAVMVDPIDIEVRVPAGSSLICETVAAGVETTGPLAETEVTTVSGPVRIDAVTRPVLHTTSGSVRIDALTAAGQARVQTVSGPIRVHAAGEGGRLHARSVSGAICVSGQRLVLDARSVSGQVTVQ